MSNLQREILELASQYFDGYFPIRTIENEEAIRNVSDIYYNLQSKYTIVCVCIHMICIMYLKINYS